jgi:hypothetical protein
LVVIGVGNENEADLIGRRGPHEAITSTSEHSPGVRRLIIKDYTTFASSTRNTRGCDFTNLRLSEFVPRSVGSWRL